MTKWLPEMAGGHEPLYRQVAEAIRAAIQAGELVADEKLPTHRALAEQLGVTTGTITRAYAEAERRGLVYGMVGSGTFVRGKTVDAREWQFMELPKPDSAIKFTLNLPLMTNRAEIVADALHGIATRTEHVRFLLDYQPDVGVLMHRQILADWVARDTECGRWEPSADQVVVTNGGQHGIMLGLMTLCRAGDTVLAEALTYPGFAAVSRQLDLQVRALAMDEYGIMPEALEAACKQYAPRALFCTPTLQNPTVAIMPLERRQAVVDICRRYDVMIIEDEVNAGLLENPPVPLAKLAPDQVVHVCGFSKILAAGVRVGYCIAPKVLQNRLGAAVRATCWMVSPIMVDVVCHLLQTNAIEDCLSHQREEVIARGRSARDIFSGFSLVQYPGSLHAWLKLPEPWRADDFVAAAIAHGVEIMNPGMFSINRSVSVPAVRLSLTTEPEGTRMVQGLRILADILRAGPHSPVVA